MKKTTWIFLLILAFIAYCLLRKKRKDEEAVNEN